ncbi:hypothetical protein JCM10213v2_002252 [Rhodosporidiobolus nylandii]
MAALAPQERRSTLEERKTFLHSRKGYDMASPAELAAAGFKTYANMLGDTPSVVEKDGLVGEGGGSDAALARLARGAAPSKQATGGRKGGSKRGKTEKARQPLQGEHGEALPKPAQVRAWGVRLLRESGKGGRGLSAPERSGGTVGGGQRGSSGKRGKHTDTSCESPPLPAVPSLDTARSSPASPVDAAGSLFSSPSRATQPLSVDAGSPFGVDRSACHASEAGVELDAGGPGDFGGGWESDVAMASPGEASDWHGQVSMDLSEDETMEKLVEETRSPLSTTDISTTSSIPSDSLHASHPNLGRTSSGSASSSPSGAAPSSSAPASGSSSAFPRRTPRKMPSLPSLSSDSSLKPLEESGEEEGSGGQAAASASSNATPSSSGRGASAAATPADTRGIKISKSFEGTKKMLQTWLTEGKVIPVSKVSAKSAQFSLHSTDGPVAFSFQHPDQYSDNHFVRLRIATPTVDPVLAILRGSRTPGQRSGYPKPTSGKWTPLSLSALRPTEEQKLKAHVRDAVLGVEKFWGGRDLSWLPDTVRQAATQSTVQRAPAPALPGRAGLFSASDLSSNSFSLPLSRPRRNLVYLVGQVQRRRKRLFERWPVKKAHVPLFKGMKMVRLWGEGDDFRAELAEGKEMMVSELVGDENLKMLQKWRRAAIKIM